MRITPGLLSPKIISGMTVADILYIFNFSDAFAKKYKKEYWELHRQSGPSSYSSYENFYAESKDLLLKQIKELSELEKIILDLPKELW